MLNLGKMSEISGLNKLLVLVENWWYSYSHFVLLISLFIRDVAEMKEVSLWKSDKILQLSVLLACKQVERIAYILRILWAR